MSNKLVCFVALLLVLAVSARLVNSCRHAFRDVKMSIAVPGSAESGNELSDQGNDVSAWVNQPVKSPLLVVSLKNTYFSNGSHPLLPGRLFAVPTPPPWA